MRTLTIEVGPDRSSASCEDEGGKFQLPELLASVDAEFKDNLRDRFALMPPERQGDRPGSFPLGVFFREAYGTIVRFQVEALQAAPAARNEE